MAKRKGYRSRQANTEGSPINGAGRQAGVGKEESPLGFVTLQLWPQSLTSWVMDEFGFVWGRVYRCMFLQHL